MRPTRQPTKPRKRKAMTPYRPPAPSCRCGLPISTLTSDDTTDAVDGVDVIATADILFPAKNGLWVSRRRLGRAARRPLDLFSEAHREAAMGFDISCGRFAREVISMSKHRFAVKSGPAR